MLLFLTNIFGANIAFQPGEVHIALDFTGWDIGSCQVRDHFIHRAVQTAPVPQTVDSTVIAGPEQVIERWKRITGLPFGKHTSAVSCLIYDKTHEIKYHSKEKGWFHDLWLAQKHEDGAPAWDGETPVWRIEFRFKRPALHEFDLENVYDVLDHIPDLWAYAAGHVGGADGLPDGWLRYVVPSEDTNRSRWPVHPCWQMIQGAFLPPVPASVPVDMQPFQRQCKRSVNMMRALAAVAGYTSTVEAWRRGYADERKREEPDVEPDISDTFHFLDERGRDYRKLVQKKRVIYRLASAAA